MKNKDCDDMDLMHIIQFAWLVDTTTTTAVNMDWTTPRANSYQGLQFLKQLILKYPENQDDVINMLPNALQNNVNHRSIMQWTYSIELLLLPSFSNGKIASSSSLFQLCVRIEQLYDQIYPDASSSQKKQMLEEIYDQIFSKGLHSDTAAESQGPLSRTQCILRSLGLMLTQIQRMNRTLDRDIPALVYSYGIQLMTNFLIFDSEQKSKEALEERDRYQLQSLLLALPRDMIQEIVIQGLDQILQLDSIVSGSSFFSIIVDQGLPNMWKMTQMTRKESEHWITTLVNVRRDNCSDNRSKNLHQHNLFSSWRLWVLMQSSSFALCHELGPWLRIRFETSLRQAVRCAKSSLSSHEILAAFRSQVRHRVMHDPLLVLEALATTFASISLHTFSLEIQWIEKQQKIASVPFHLSVHPPPEITTTTTLVYHTNVLVEFYMNIFMTPSSITPMILRLLRSYRPNDDDGESIFDSLGDALLKWKPRLRKDYRVCGTSYLNWCLLWNQLIACASSPSLTTRLLPELVRCPDKLLVTLQQYRESTTTTSGVSESSSSSSSSSLERELEWEIRQFLMFSNPPNLIELTDALLHVVFQRRAYPAFLLTLIESFVKDWMIRSRVGEYLRREVIEPSVASVDHEHQFGSRQRNLYQRLHAISKIFPTLSWGSIVTAQVMTCVLFQFDLESIPAQFFQSIMTECPTSCFQMCWKFAATLLFYLSSKPDRACQDVWWKIYRRIWNVVRGKGDWSTFPVWQSKKSVSTPERGEEWISVLVFDPQKKILLQARVHPSFNVLESSFFCTSLENHHPPWNFPTFAEDSQDVMYVYYAFEEWLKMILMICASSTTSDCWTFQSHVYQSLQQLYLVIEFQGSIELFLQAYVKVWLESMDTRFPPWLCQMINTLRKGIQGHHQHQHQHHRSWKHVLIPILRRTMIIGHENPEELETQDARVVAHVATLVEQHPFLLPTPHHPREWVDFFHSCSQLEQKHMWCHATFFPHLWFSLYQSYGHDPTETLRVILDSILPTSDVFGSQLSTHWHDVRCYLHYREQQQPQRVSSGSESSLRLSRFLKHIEDDILPRVLIL